MARTVVKGPLSFTVGSDQNLEAFDSSFVLVTGSGAGTIIAQASTDKLTHAFGDTAAYVYRDGTPTYSGDQYAKVAISGVSNPARYGVAVRVGSGTGASANWYAMVVDTNSFPPNRETWLLKCVGGSVTQLSNVVDTWADGDTVELEAITNGANCDLKLYKNGTLLRTVTDASSPLTGGKPGIYARSTSSYQMALDELELGDVTAGPVLTGNITADDAVASGSMAPTPPSSITGNITADDAVASGTLGATPGTVTVGPFKNSAGDVLPSTTIPLITFLRASDGLQVLTLTNQVTTSSPTAPMLAVTHANLVQGVQYAVASWDGTFAASGIEPATAT